MRRFPNFTTLASCARRGCVKHWKVSVTTAVRFNLHRLAKQYVALNPKPVTMKNGYRYLVGPYPQRYGSLH